MLVALSLVIVVGMVGLAMDAGQLYVTKQKAQAAADAAAQAGVMDMYNGTSVPAGNCPTTGGSAACVYARLNGFGGSVSDTVTIDFPDSGAAPGVTLSGSDTPNLIRAVVQRTVNTTFMRVLPLAPTTVNVSATAIAAISVTPSPIPILVLHPTLSGSFSKNGSNTITICGGPARAIQVNSSSTTSISISGNSGTIDLSHAGPLDAGDCVAGTGADFANVGAQTPFPSGGNLLLGTKPGAYVEPASAIKDPLLGVAAPAQPAAAPSPTTYTTAATQAAHNCPAGLPNNACQVFSPGYYPNGINLGGSNKVFAQFRPGIYWINSGGFQLGSNSIVRMAQAPDNSDPVTGTGWTQGMLIYNNGSGVLSIASNAGQIQNVTYPTANCTTDVVNNTGGNCLVGSPGTSSYKGILFFQNHVTASSLNHSFSGGGGLSLTGTIYLTHTAANIRADGTYQSLTLQGNSGGATKVQGEIIADKLALGGSSGITMNLISTPIFSVRQVALVK
jgi:hypothetical protein